MKNIYKFLIVVLVIAILIVVGVLIYLKINPNNFPCRPPFCFPGRPVPDSTNNIVGGDRDEHGCIGSAGYSWCEPKQKCLRQWEESCN